MGEKEVRAKRGVGTYEKKERNEGVNVEEMSCRQEKVSEAKTVIIDVESWIG